MIIALLFDWKVYSQESNYWHEIRTAVFSTDLIQISGQHMKLAIGDVLVGIEAGQDAERVFNATFNNSDFALFYKDRILEGFPTIFGMVFENMPSSLASDIHRSLREHVGYLGAFSVHLEFGPHLALYRNRLPPQYRLQGRRLRSFYSMGNMDGCDEYDLQEMRLLGYDDVAFEDTGASRTILDDYDTPRHFARVAAFRDILTDGDGAGEDDAYELTMLLEDLSPKLFNALGAASERLVEAENEEEVAQVALSGRRYIEQLADALYPPIEGPEGGRRLDKVSYKNRLWAFVERAVGKNDPRLRTIGSEIDRVVKDVNAGLHADRSRDAIAATIRDAAKLTAVLLGLKPATTTNGYLAYANALQAFLRELQETSSSDA